jgi:hypothetical protein
MMAKADFPLNIDRRRLLATALALPAASIVPGFQGGEPANLAGAAQPLSPPSAAPALNVSVATARRLAEIGRRNEIRREAGLPALSVLRELRRMKEQADREEFERFAAAKGRAVLEEILRPRREAEGPNWQPSWMEAVSYQSEGYNILREKFRASCQAAGNINAG